MDEQREIERDVKIYRYHPFFIIKPIFKILVFLLIIFGQELLTILEEGFSFEKLISEDILGTAILGGGIFLLFLVPAMINATITYYKSHIELTKDSITYKKATFFSRKSKETPLSQISNLNFNRSITDRVFSTIEVHMDINSSETADESDYSILLSHSDALEFKELFEIYSREGLVENDTGQVVATNESVFDQLYDYRGIESWRHIILNSSFSVVLLGAGSAAVILSDTLKNFSIFSFLVIFFGFVFDIIKNVSKYYDYQVKANDEYINWQAGLLQNKEFTIAKKSIRAVEVHQTFIARLFNYYSIDIKVVGVGNSAEEVMTVILYKKKDKAMNILHELLPGIDLNFDFERENLKVGIAKAVANGLVSSSLLYFEIVRSYIWIYLLGLIVVIVATLSISRGKGFKYNGDKIRIRSSFLGMHTTTISLENIDHACIKKQPLFSKFGLRKIELFYKDNTGPNVITTGYFPAQRFSVLVNDLVN